MIREATFYAVQCDYPGCTFDTSDCGEYASWMDKGYAVEEWTESENLIVVGDDGVERHYCREHTIWNDDDDGEPRIPLPEGIEGEFIIAERRIALRIAVAVDNAQVAHRRRCDQWARRDKDKFDQIDARIMREASIRTIARIFDIPMELLEPDGTPRWLNWEVDARQIAV